MRGGARGIIAFLRAQMSCHVCVYGGEVEGVYHVHYYFRVKTPRVGDTDNNLGVAVVIWLVRNWAIAYP